MPYKVSSNDWNPQAKQKIALMRDEEEILYGG